jgi:threonine 3-dehydrogenase
LAASICGSDIHIYDDDPVFRERIRDGQVIGHEFCGVVEEIGSQVTTLAVGDIVSAESHVVCGSCYYCLNGMSHICHEMEGIGFDRAGGFAEYVAIPAKAAVAKPPNISIEIGAILEPLGNALDTARCVNLSGKRVLVTGCGPQGAMAIAIAKADGALQVIVTEVYQKRRDIAKRMLAEHANPRQGVTTDLVLDATSPDLVERIFEATGGLGVDVVIEMSGHPNAISDACTVLRNGGEFVALGLPSRPISFDWANHLVLKAATYHGIYGRHLYTTWFQVHNLVQSRTIRLESLITHHFPLTNQGFESAFRLLKQGQAMKVIFYPDLAYRRQFEGDMPVLGE